VCEHDQVSIIAETGTDQGLRPDLAFYVVDLIGIRLTFDG